jgi:hypothetical protein
MRDDSLVRRRPMPTKRLGAEQARKLKQLELENSRLKKLVADLSLEKQVLKDIAGGPKVRASETCEP